MLLGEEPTHRPHLNLQDLARCWNILNEKSTVDIVACERSLLCLGHGC
jgi:hypothetical protein